MPRNKQQMPMCQYGASCTRKGCVYRHPPKSERPKRPPKNAEICVHYVSGLCSFGDRCANRHPGKAEAQKFRLACASVACRFGASCANASCLYNHDGRAPPRIPNPPPAPAPQPVCAADFDRADAEFVPSRVDDSFVPAPLPAPEPAQPAPLAGQAPFWWRAEGVFGERDCDPISLEPLAELEYPPFGLQEEGQWHFFDGAVLATYLVSTATFANPLTRRPLGREACRALDDYLEEHKLRAGLGDVFVTHAFDLLEMTARGGAEAEGASAMASRSQREATTVLRSLFGFARYEPPPEPENPNAARYEDSRAAFDGNARGGGGVTLAGAIDEREAEEAPFQPRPLGGLDAEDLPPPPLDTSSFPALSALGLALDDDLPPPSLGPSFADRAAKPALPQPALPRPAQPAAPRQRRDVTVPREIWVPLRNARVFEVRDPLERYQLVSAAHDRPDVVDLHFQSNRTAPVVLEAVLDRALRANPDGVWVVTGCGHHVPQNSHQKQRAPLFQYTQSYLEEHRYEFSVAKDHNGFAGA
eukprot:CAMPEP_0119263544 /NCGR_PEP_ID=MMETSP1329-20130426/2912_1 /TAXON_ID=114041 /ORGANISM="Genus nov. species nov., Strain RCC1024" /LENGTH=529 /DNA_ID=CAMNT_0007263255 /DNA_START=203 /DNA_END=1789 /DNA_ORIENTATION=+